MLAYSLGGAHGERGEGRAGGGESQSRPGGRGEGAAGCGKSQSQPRC